MRKRLVGVLLAGLVVAGCGTSGGSPREGGQDAPPPAPKPPEPARKAPAKATAIPDKCAILTQQQQQEFGLDYPPEARESNGDPGCVYQAGELGRPGWNGFVGVSSQTTFGKQAKRHRSNAQQIDVAGYPAIAVRDTTGCIVYADISDNGFSIANLSENSMQRSGLDLCQQAKKVTEAALQNVPNA